MLASMHGVLLLQHRVIIMLLRPWQGVTAFVQCNNAVDVREYS